MKLTRIIICSIILLLLTTTGLYSQTNNLEQQYFSKPNKFHFGADAGSFMGSPADAFLAIKDQFTSRIYYGFWGQYIRMVKPSLGLGIQYKILYKEVPNYDYSNPRGTHLSFLSNYYFSIDRKNSYYLHVKLGQAKITQADGFTNTSRPDTQQNDEGIIMGGTSYYSLMDDYGWSWNITVGFGMYTKTGSTTSTIAILYYQHIFLDQSVTDFDIQMIGLRIGFGFQL